MVCEQYEQLREFNGAALREWYLANTAPTWTKDAASRMHEAHEALGEAMELLAQHKWNCVRCVDAMPLRA